MRRILPILLPAVMAIVAAALMLLHAARAQTIGAPSVGMGIPAMGTTSPLGVPGATSAPTSAGVPLGSTEINPGGLSPMPATTCLSGSSGTFDGGGLTGCSASSTQMQPGVGAQPIPAPGSDPTLAGANIPLSATETTTNAGLSPPITVLGAVPGTVPGTTVGVAPMNTMTSPTMALPTITTPTMTTPPIQGQ
jgi:hypothetical protein